MGPTVTSDERSPRGSKAEMAYETIRGQIVDGTFGPGYRLVLDRLAVQLGVSAVPVREALRRLEAEGYVDFKRNLGATVRQIDVSDYVQTMEALAVLEGTATALAAPLMDGYQIRKAQRLNDDLKRALEHLDPAAYGELEQQFHEALYAACPNSYLVDLIHREGVRLRGISNAEFAFVPERVREAVAEHERLLELIEGHADPGRVEDYAREHRSRTARRLAERHGLAR